MMKHFLVASAAVAIAMLGAGPLTAQQSTIVQKIIVKVNGEIFTQSELEFQQIQTLRDQNRAVRKAEDLSSDPVLRTALAEITPGLLIEAVNELMLVQHGRETGIKFNDATFAKGLEEMKKSNNITDDAAFQAALKQEGITLSDLRVRFERQFIIQNVIGRELQRNMTLTEEEMRQYFNTHQSEFMKPPTVTLREILIPVPTETVNGQATVNVGVDDAAKEKIAAIRERAVKGEDYTKLVAEASESGTKANGGLIGPIAAADLNPAVSQMLEKMQVGDISEPMRTRAGYQILKLETRSAAEVEAFEKSREQIQQNILGARVEVERAKFLEKLRLQAVIEWKDDAYKKMYEAARETKGK
jgi:peptidyl-prolyl cis-trans isomerase SurA